MSAVGQKRKWLGARSISRPSKGGLFSRRQKTKLGHCWIADFGGPAPVARATARTAGGPKWGSQRAPMSTLELRAQLGHRAMSALCSRLGRYHWLHGSVCWPMIRPLCGASGSTKMGNSRSKWPYDLTRQDTTDSEPLGCRRWPMACLARLNMDPKQQHHNESDDGPDYPYPPRDSGQQAP
jgi:hypothetical protein